jgi:hypothetical protein
MRSCPVCVIHPVAGRPQIWSAASARYRDDGVPRAGIWDTLSRSLQWSRFHDPVLRLDQGSGQRARAGGYELTFGAGEEERGDAAAPRGHGETILLVDDETQLVSLGEEMLAMLGYEPVGFHNSAAALAAFRADPQRFDLALTDEVMPEMTGTESRAR